MTNLIDWSDPVQRSFTGGAWVSPLISHFEMILRWVHGIGQDPVFQQEFQAAAAILDRLPQPSTPESANRRWREFVVAVWKALESWKQRRVKR